MRSSMNEVVISMEEVGPCSGAEEVETYGSLEVGFIQIEEVGTCNMIEVVI